MTVVEIKELTEGDKYNRLTVTRKIKPGFYEFLCDCGNTKNVKKYDVSHGKVKSCGCWKRERTTKRNTTHGMAKSSEYNSWRSMKERCLNPKNSHYKYYGEKGISFDPRWDVFENFYEDMGERPEGLTLDRIDTKLNYFKDNCKWSTIPDQNFNQDLRMDNKTGVAGVIKRGNIWVASIRCKKKFHYLGTFNSFLDAVEARVLAELEFYGTSKVNLKRY